LCLAGRKIGLVAESLSANVLLYIWCRYRDSAADVTDHHTSRRPFLQSYSTANHNPHFTTSSTTIARSRTTHCDAAAYSTRRNRQEKLAGRIQPFADARAASTNAPAKLGVGASVQRRTSSQSTTQAGQGPPLSAQEDSAEFGFVTLAGRRINCQCALPPLRRH